MLYADAVRETAVESHLVKECARLRVLCVKNKGLRGFPDRTIYWFDGIVDLIETKRPKGGRFEPLQLRTHEKLRKRGHNVHIINTQALVDEYIATREQYGRLVGVKI